MTDGELEPGLSRREERGLMATKYSGELAQIGAEVRKTSIYIIF